jgi:hypothetical protein
MRLPMLSAVACSIVLISGCKRPAPIRMDSSLPISLTVSPENGAVQRLTAIFRDPRGGAHIRTVTISVMSSDVTPGGHSRWSSKECIVHYELAASTIRVTTNLGGEWEKQSAKAGSEDTVSNSQCTVIARESSAIVSGNDLTIQLALDFAPEFAGEKKIYLTSEDAEGVLNANYKQVFGKLTVAPFLHPTN